MDRYPFRSVYPVPILVRAVPVRRAVPMTRPSECLRMRYELVSTPVGVCRNDDNVLPGFIDEALFLLSLLCLLDEIVNRRPWWKEIGLDYSCRI